jgi:Xaa-Pro aminopeptidase
MTDLTAEKVDQARRILDELEIDCWLSFVRESLECTDPALPLIFPYSLTWQSALIITPKATTAIVGSHDAPAVKSLGVWDDVIGYTDSISESLRKVIDEVNPQQIALNYSPDDTMSDGLSHGMYTLLEKYLPKHVERFTSAQPIITRLRGRKSAAETKLITDAINEAEKIFRAVEEFAHVGTSEIEIAEFMRDRAREGRMGLAWDEQMCPIVCTGPQSMTGHAVPSSDLGIQPGCILHLDFGVKKDGYCSDNQRVWYVPADGETAPPEPVQKAFDAIRSAIDAAMSKLKPGVQGWEVDAAARKVITDAGFPPYDHAVGHQVGRCAHDGGATLAPKWQRYGNTPEIPIEAGNVFTLEPTLMDVDGRGTMGLEEIVVVTDDGCEYLSPPQTELKLIHG